MSSVRRGRSRIMCRNRYLIWQPVSESSLRLKAQIGQKRPSGIVSFEIHESEVR
jgi:hypothetical protein